VEHIIPQSHGGTDDLDNVALACPMCNCYKFDHILGIDDQGSDGGQLFHPRTDRWKDHFEFDSETLQVRGNTKKGQGTVNRLRMNDAPQIEVRKHWIELGLYP
jgi:HNH endonuclease